MNHPVELLHPLPENCTYEQAALAEPLSVVLHASRRVNLQKGQSVLVLGAGAVGLLACALAKASGASRVATIDIDSAKLEFVKSAGFANLTYCPPRLERPKTSEEALRRAKESSAQLLELFKIQEGFDVVVECTGAESCIQMAVHCARTGGKVALVGMGTPNPTLPLSAAACREVDLVGVFRYANTYPAALALLASGKLRGIEKMVTQRFPLDRTAQAFEMLAKGKDEKGGLVLKVMVGPTY